ncbi:MAG: hypothetical protein KDK30_06120 [Leptospiraceae bacterium]|nr:hypothetical protein [Leptospiraceae bacterium]
MQVILYITLSAWMAGVTAYGGGLIARIEGSAETRIKRRIVHGVIAFGGGILLAAVCFALLPESMERLSIFTLGTTFVSGGILFAVLDAFQSRHGGTRAQFLAMLMDFVPEALSLGAVFSQNRRLGVLLAVFIALQNLPEGFNAFREMRKAGSPARLILGLLLGISLLGPVCALLGYFFLQNHPVITAGIMSFASGGILYLIFQDIAPQSKMRRHWSPTLGSVFGFLTGMLGHVLIM